MKKTAIIIMTLLAGSVMSLAQTSSVILPFMEIDHNPVTSAMAGASVLAEPDASDVWASYQLWKPSTTSYFSANGAVNFGKFTVKVGGTYGAGAEYKTSTGVSGASTSFKPSDMMFGAGAAFRISEKFGAEIGAKYASSTIAQNSTYAGFAADIILRGYFNDVKIAAGAVNLGPAVKGFKIPAAAMFAVAYDNGQDAVHRLHSEIDAKYYFCGSFGLSAGLAYTYNNLLSVRAGYHFGGVVADHASVGLGVNIKGLHLDASYILGTGLVKNSLCFGLGYRF